LFVFDERKRLADEMSVGLTPSWTRRCAKVRSAEGVGVYGNYVNPDVPASKIYGNNAKKLVELKKKYDPENLFDRGTRLIPRPVVVVN
jgi:hypothetical protein